ncbi:P1 family peptidase [Nonomuraea sp. K274]|uniref:P1 family peptidase n=1 Tax=Nonomuraea cypriaca TaxID=1187855 RepID=A0A931F2X5_9ACTN|nr:P1 family peptidase [Nonomuraea cypriaca]MBF8191092.1 P1 family peptidase [Nonomuraea cypriaca]
MRPGPTNSLLDVAGLRVGHAQRVGGGHLTGTTVVLAPREGAVAGVDVRGAAPGTRETELLDPRNLVERVHAVVLSGGSSYGLAAASGVMDRLGDAGVGYPVEGGVVPIVPAAVIFDLGRGGTFRAVPDACLGTAAYDAATSSRCGKLAAVAHDGLARAIRPAHTMTDGDTIFGLATCARPAPGHDAFQEVLAAAADVFSRAIAHAILAATGRTDAPAYLDVFPSAQGGGL